MSEEQNSEWTTEWPREEGPYWLYGRVGVSNVSSEVVELYARKTGIKPL